MKFQVYITLSITLCAAFLLIASVEGAPFNVEKGKEDGIVLAERAWGKNTFKKVFGSKSSSNNNNAGPSNPPPPPGPRGGQDRNSGDASVRPASQPGGQDKPPHYDDIGADTPDYSRHPTGQMQQFGYNFNMPGTQNPGQRS